MERWQLRPLAELISYRNEFIDIDDSSEYKRVRVQLHAKGIVLRDTVKGLELKTKQQQICKKGDFLVAEIDAKVGGFGIVPDNLEGAIVSSHYFLFDIDELKLDRKFLGYFLKKPEFQNQIVARGSTNYAAIRPQHVLGIKIPLPTKEEQERIVFILENVTRGIEKLSALQEEQDQFLSKLRQAILQEAVQGKLVPQDSTDEPATELLKRNKAEKERLIREKKIKKERPLPPISDDEIPYELPKGWVWVRLQDITALITCGLASTPKYVKYGMPFLSAKNVKPYRFIPQSHNYVSYEDYQRITKNGKPEVNDILLTRVGAGIGEAAIIDQSIEFAYYVSLTLIKPIFSDTLSPYLLHWLNSPEGIGKSLGNTYGKGTSPGNLNVNQVRRFVVPFPPLNEQKRIVAKVDELMKLCEELEEQFRQSKQESERLMQAVLQEAFEGKYSEEPDQLVSIA